QFAQPLYKSADQLTFDWQRALTQISDGRQLPSLLRACRDRPCDRPADQRNEPSPPQVKHGAAPRPSVRRNLSLPPTGALVPGVYLNVSESRLSMSGLPIGQSPTLELSSRLWSVGSDATRQAGRRPTHADRRCAAAVNRKTIAVLPDTQRSPLHRVRLPA